MIPSLLSKETAAELRRVVFEESEREKADKTKQHTQATVIEPDNRWHGMPHIEDAIVRRALREIGEHPIFRPLIEDVMTPMASLVSLSVIRADYGSSTQGWHVDTGLMKTPWGYDNPYVFDTYSVGIALQDITPGMGETGVCPGVHTPTGGGPEGMDDEGNCDCYYQRDDGTVDSPDGLMYEKGNIDDMCVGVAPIKR